MITSSNAIALSMDHGDSIFLLRDPGIHFQRIDTGKLSDNIIIWIDKNEILTKENVIGYYFSKDGDIPLDYGYIKRIGAYGFIMITSNVIPMSSVQIIKNNYWFTYNEIKKNNGKWEHYIFFKEEEK